MRKDSIEICYETHQLITQIFHRGERTPTNHLPHDHPKTPRSGSATNSASACRRTGLHDSAPTRIPGDSTDLGPHAPPSSPAAPCSHTPRPPPAPRSPSNGCSSYPRRTPTTRPGRIAIVCSMWLAKSASVRIGPMDRHRESNCPVVTWKLPMRVNVPCRSYSNSIRGRYPGDHQLGRSDPLQRLNVRVIKLIDAPLIKIIDGVRGSTSARSTGGVVLLPVSDKGICRARRHGGLTSDQSTERPGLGDGKGLTAA